MLGKFYKKFSALPKSIKTKIILALSSGLIGWGALIFVNWKLAVPLFLILFCENLNRSINQRMGL